MPDPALQLLAAPTAEPVARMSLHPRLEAAFALLDATGIRWCLLRGEDELAAADGDVDLLVDAASLATARAALVAAGFAYVPSWGRGSHRFLLAYDVTADRWLKLDLVTELEYGPYQELRVRGAAAACLTRRRRSGPVWLLSPHDGFWTLLLHALLDRAIVRDADLARLARLAPAAGNAPPAELAGLLAPSDEATVGEAAAAGRRAELTEIAGRAHTQAASGRRLRRRVLRALGRRSPVLGRRGAVVALLGPDGAGKSSLAEALESGFPVPVRRLYAGLYARRGRTRLPFAPAFVRRLARSVTAGLRARVWRARGGLVIFDRHPYDALIPPRHPSGRRSRLRRRLLAHACVRPDVVLLLDAPPTVLRRRKTEHDVTELRRQRDAYRTLEKRLRHVVVVDAVRDPDAVRREVTARIWQRYAEVGEQR